MTVYDTQANFVRHERCENCGSSDANARYDDGHLYCFSCQTHTPSEEGEEPTGSASATSELPATDNSKQKTPLLEGEVKAIAARRLTEESCRKFGYLTGMHNGQPVQIAVYRDEQGRPVAQKLRNANKQFQIIGDGKQLRLFGSHLWSKGKKLVITEGEVDCITVSQIQNHKWATVSLPSGAPSAVKAIKNNWDYLENFEEVILMFDQDDAGQKAAQEVAEILPVGKVKIASLPSKDANQCLLDGKSGAVIEAIWQAKSYRPDGIIAATDLRGVITVDEAASSVSYPYSALDSILRGIRRQEMVVILAGSGIGKSTFVTEIAHHLHSHGQRLGMLMLEEATKRTMLRMTGIQLNKNIIVDRSQATDEEVLAGFDSLTGEGKPLLHLYDGFGSNDIDNIVARIRYMVSALGCDTIILDHISILVSASEGDERRMIDAACTKFRTLVQELNFTLFMVSHLRRPDGDRGHEAGASVRLSQARGSHAIAQLSDACIAIEPDIDDPDADIRHLRVLKNRYTGETGNAGTLVFNRDTGRLLEESLAHLTEQGDEIESNDTTATRDQLH